MEKNPMSAASMSLKTIAAHPELGTKYFLYLNTKY